MSKRLSVEEIEELLKGWRELKDKKCFALLVEKNQGLVNFFSYKYLGKGLTFDELKSAGNVGLVNAINKIDYKDNGVEKFSSYISIAIENGIKYELRKYQKHSHVMSFEEPIGSNKDGDELKLEDLLGTDADELIEDVIAEIKIDIVREALQSLTSREKKIILLRYGLDDTHKKTLDEVAEILNCSSATIAKQEQKALVKMRHPRNTRKLKDFIDE